MVMVRIEMMFLLGHRQGRAGMCNRIPKAWSRLGRVGP
jgi:hypothetical protein